jgi:hypothetical protein
MGSSKPQTVTQEVPAEAKPFLYGDKGILNRAQAISEQPLNLPDYQVAGFSAPQMQAFNLAQSGIGGYLPALTQGSRAIGQGIGAAAQGMGMIPQALSGAQGYFSDARGGINQAVGTSKTGLLEAGAQARGAVDSARPFMGGSATTALSSARQYDPRTSYQDYMNPYIEEVIRKSEGDIYRQGELQAQGMRAQAVGAGAFGGSRQAVAERELGRNIQEQQARTSADLRAQGYGQAQQQAQQAFEQQQQRGMSAAQLLGNLGTSYGQLGLQGSGQLADIYSNIGQLGLQGTSQLANMGSATGQMGLQGAGQMGALSQGLGALGTQQANLGQLGQQMQLRDVGALMDIGTAQQAQAQAGLDALRQNQYQRTMAPYQQLGFFSDIYQGMPVGQMTTQPGPSAVSQIAGLGMGLYGLTRPQA